MYGVALIIIMFLAAGCFNKPELREIIKENKDKRFKYCMKEGRTDGQSLINLRRECKRYVEVSEKKDKAVKKCTKWKTEEIGWTTKEVDIYCNKFWRGYR